jgi:23S rRNA pseudouridine2605 synthase
MGLARALSKLGYCSRANAAELIRAGRVQLNGAVRRDPETPVDLARDRIAVDGAAVAAHAKSYLMLNKPRGIVTTASDEKGRDTVYDLLPRDLPWLAPVGRLDKASEGLLLLSNDSEWAAQIAAPESHLEKKYHVQIAALADDALLQSLERGVRTTPSAKEVADVLRYADAAASRDGAWRHEPPRNIARGGELLRARRARILRHGEKNSWLEIVLDEGKNRQIRRMLDAHGIEVLRLIRVAIGPVALGTLPKGATRPLTREEKHSLDSAIISARDSRGK